VTDPAAPAAVSPAASTAVTPPGRPPSALAELLLRISAIAVGTAGAVLVALVSGFLVPFRVKSVTVPVCVLIVIIGNVLAIRFVYQVTGSKLAIAWPALGWLVTTLPLTIRQTEGDLIITDSLTGLAVLFGGSLALAVAAYLVIIKPPPPPGQQAPPGPPG
jgi:hypothetical protein